MGTSDYLTSICAMSTIGRNDQNLWMALGGVACKARTFPRMIYKERSL